MMIAQHKLAVPPMWKVLIVSCVPGSPIDCAAIIPTVDTNSTRSPFDISIHNTAAQTPRFAWHVNTERTGILETAESA